MHREKGSGSFFVLGIFLILLTVVVSATLSVSRGKMDNFKTSFAFEKNLNMSNLNDEDRKILQPIVTKRLVDLKNQLQTAQKEKEEILNLPETSDPKVAVEKISKLHQTEVIINSLSDTLAKAEKSAKYFGFKT